MKLTRLANKTNITFKKFYVFYSVNQPFKYINVTPWGNIALFTQFTHFPLFTLLTVFWLFIIFNIFTLFTILTLFNIFTNIQLLNQVYI